MNSYTKQILLPLYSNAMFNIAKDGRRPFVKRAFSWPWNNNPFSVYNGWKEGDPTPPVSGGSSSSASGSDAPSPPSSSINREELVNFLKERFPALAAATAAPAAAAGGGRRIIRRYGDPPRRRHGFRMEMGNMRMGDFFDDGPRHRRRRPRYYEEEIVEPAVASAAAPAAASAGGGFNRDEFFSALDEWLAAHTPTAPTPTPPPAPTPPPPELKYSDADLARKKSNIDASVAADKALMDRADQELNDELDKRDENRRKWKAYRNYSPMVSFGGAALGGTLASALYDRITGKNFNTRSWGDWWLKSGLTGLGALAGFGAGAYVNNRYLRPTEDLSKTPMAKK